MTEPASAPAPRDGELFLAFLAIGIQGFGGVMPWARRMLVEQRRWLSESEFIEVLSLAQFLPGPNIINVAIIVGRQFGGWSASLAAAVGLMVLPFLIVLILAAVYARFAAIEAVRGATDGVSAAATGLVIAMAVRLAYPLRASRWQLPLALATFVLIALARLPLSWVLAAMAPIAIALAWRTR